MFRLLAAGKFRRELFPYAHIDLVFRIMLVAIPDELLEPYIRAQVIESEIQPTYEVFMRDHYDTLLPLVRRFDDADDDSSAPE